MKQYVVAGVDWFAEVDLSDYNLDSPQTEAATRAVESLIGKRKDIKIHKHKSKLPKKFKNELNTALFGLLQDELTKGCRIGILLAISDGENEWYVNSKVILENVGLPKLVDVYNVKYPDKKEKTS